MIAATRVLAIGAHPDDLEVGAGGLIARLCASGATVTMAVVSIPDRVDLRREEARAAAKILGARSVVIETERECRVEDLAMHELVRRFDLLISEIRPELVITHSAHDLHWDHGLVHRATVSALRRTACDLLAYLSSPELNAQTRSIGTCFADISAHVDQKLSAIACHQSQAVKLDLDSSRDLARAMGRVSGFAFAEVYEAARLRV
ncbi:MAG: PIG-L deacetylase family protein [Deltaproteobacteria bacterium]